MYDTVKFKLTREYAPDADFLGAARYFDVSFDGKSQYGNRIITGTLKNYRLTVSENGINMKGSLCKWYLGDNFQTLNRTTTQQAIEKMSAELHLPIDRATVTRLDFAENFILNYPVDVYYNHLGLLKFSKRCPVVDNGIEGINYFQRGGLLVFYDKIKQTKRDRQPIPEPYQNKHVLRYEQRFKSRLPKVFNVERVTGALLFDAAFYGGLVDRWGDTYGAIEKINDITINLESMSGVRDLNALGLLALVERQGGQLAMIEIINESQRTGKITKKEAYDMREAIKKACTGKHNITAPNDVIVELNQKVTEAVKRYR